MGLVQANYNIFPLGTEKGWSGWYLLIVDYIRGGKGGFLLIVDFQFFVYIFSFWYIYNIFPLGKEQWWSGWHLLIVDSIRGGKGGSS